MVNNPELARKLPEAEKSQKISVSLTPVTLAKLNAEVKRTGKAQSRVVETALEGYLDFVSKVYP